MATFNNGESGSSVRTKINEAIDKVDGNAAFDNDIDVNGNVEVTGDLTVDSTTLHVDSTNNRVGIGLTDPQIEFHIKGSTPQVRLQPTGDTQSNRIEFCNAAGSILSQIQAGGSKGTNIEFDGDLIFSAGHGVDINQGTIDGTTIGATTPAAGTFNQATVTSTTPLINIDETDIASTHSRVTFQSSAAAFTVSTRSSAGSIVANDYIINRDASGGTLHRMAIAGVEKFRVNSSGVDVTGDLDVSGALSKSSGSFKIDHPLKPETHHLVHSFVEAPQADNIYRGKVSLVAGAATVNLDEAGRMTEGTFVALNGNIQCFTSNEDGWTSIKGSVSGNILTIQAQDASCTDTVSWLVIGERHDSHMLNTDWTDAAGRVITEPEKQTKEEE